MIEITPLFVIGLVALCGWYYIIGFIHGKKYAIKKIAADPNVKIDIDAIQKGDTP